MKNRNCENWLVRIKFIDILKARREHGIDKLRFHFGKYFTSCTITAEFVHNDIPEKLKIELKREEKRRKERRFFGKQNTILTQS